jgi:hypothetical protein
VDVVFVGAGGEITGLVSTGAGVECITTFVGPAESQALATKRINIMMGSL